MKLSESQRAMVERNMGIAYLTAYRMMSHCRAVGIEFDDAVSISFVGLCRGSQKYDQSRGGEATFFCTVCRNEVLMAVRHALPCAHIKCESYDQPAFLDGSNNSPMWEFEKEVCAQDSDPLDVILLKEFRASYLDILRDKERDALVLAMQGKSQNQIALVLGVSQSYVSRCLTHARATIRRYRNVEQIKR